MKSHILLSIRFDLYNNPSMLLRASETFRIYSSFLLGFVATIRESSSMLLQFPLKQICHQTTCLGPLIVNYNLNTSGILYISNYNPEK